MEKLNELVEMAKEISSKRWFLNADEEVTAFDNDAGADDSDEAFIGCAANIQLAKYIASASPETILAIAEAFRALEVGQCGGALLEREENHVAVVGELLKRNAELEHRTEAAEVEKTGAEERCRMMFDAKNHWADRARAAEAKLVNQDYFGSLVSKARISADKAMVKFPQPNYVLLKVAEEAGEVVQAGVHYAENRMSWGEVEGEIVQLMAMLIRLVTEGDQVNGITPPESCRDFSPAPAADLMQGEWTNEQCLEFLSIAFRHSEISGDIEMDDIRQAVKMVNAGAKNQ